MRCYYLSDLHLEADALDANLPAGEVLIVAGDTCHARCLDPARLDKYSVEQRGRTLRFFEEAARRFRHVIAIAGNHEHYDGVIEETARLMRQHLPGVTVLDDEAVEIEGVRFFGATLWTDFEGGSEAALESVRRRMGEFFFVKTREGTGGEALVRFQPRHALARFERAWAALRREADACAASGGRLVVVTHHPPSREGLNPRFAGNGLDAAYASDLAAEMARMSAVAHWVHGHTHIRKSYRVGNIEVHANCRGFPGKDASAQGFRADRFFEV